MFKKNEILSFVTTWIDTEGIMLSETSQTEKDNCCMILYVELKKNKQENKFICTENRLVADRGGC